LSRTSWDTPPARAGALLLVALLAAALRVVYVREVHDHPYYLTPLVDAADFHSRALQVMGGEGLGPGVYYKAPAYPFLLGQLYRLVGPRIEVAYALQMLGGVATAVLTAWLGMRWFGLATGLVAGLLGGLYGRMIYYENQLLIESSALFLSMVATGLVVGTRRPVWVLLAGLLAGLGLQLRPINVTLIAALLGIILLAQQEPAAIRLRRAVLLLVPILLLLGPTLRHNRIASQHVIPISVNGGINFYIGNNPDYDETVAIRPGLRWEDLTHKFGGTSDPYAWERGYYHASFTWMRHAPLQAVALGWKKIVLVWNAREIDRNQDSSVLRRVSRVLRDGSVPWVVLGSLGLVGLGLLWRREGLPVQLLLWLQLLGVVAFFVTSRYRLALVPPLAIAGGVTVAEIGAAVWRRDRRRLIFLSAALLAALLFSLPDWYGLDRKPFGRPDFDQAMVLAQHGDRVGALAAYERELARHPQDPDVVFRYGEHLERLGRREEAIAAYKRAAELAPGSYKPLLSLGSAYLVADDLPNAWTALAEAERRGDPTGRALYDMGLVRERQGRRAEALELFERSLARPDAPKELAMRRLGVGRCLVVMQRPEAAEVQFRAAAAVLPDPRAVPLERAEAWLQAGEPMRALALLQTVPDLDGSSRGQLLRARALRNLGRMEESRAAADRARQLDPESEAVRAFIARSAATQ
jgi:tetratricopeptide (TPR) repeat protein